MSPHHQEMRSRILTLKFFACGGPEGAGRGEGGGNRGGDKRRNRRSNNRERAQARGAASQPLARGFPHPRIEEKIICGNKTPLLPFPPRESNLHHQRPFLFILSFSPSLLLLLPVPLLCVLGVPPSPHTSTCVLFSILILALLC